MAYTLITSLGTGTEEIKENKKEQKKNPFLSRLFGGCKTCIKERNKQVPTKYGYRTTNYTFPNGQEYKNTKLIVEAILKSGIYDIKKVIVIGTNTSGWGALVDENSDKELYDEFFNMGKKQYLEKDSELEKRLKNHVENRWNVPFVFAIHTDEIDSKTTGEIFEVYNGLSEEIEENTDILFDITHGFRSMPVLIYQALHHFFADKKVDLIYGEYNRDANTSFVRDLSNYWKYSQITDAVNVFREKLDGTRLSNLIEKDSPNMAKIIRDITDVVQSNFSLLIVDIINQIKNSDFADDKKFFWFDSVFEVFNDICNLEDENAVSYTIFKFAGFLKNHNLHTQAVIALQICNETMIVEKFGEKELIGNYTWWSKVGREIREEICPENNPKYSDIWCLVEARNKIAHGGSTQNNEKSPEVKIITENYDSFMSSSKNLDNLLKSLPDYIIKEIRDRYKYETSKLVRNIETAEKRRYSRFLNETAGEITKIIKTTEKSVLVKFLFNENEMTGQIARSSLQSGQEEDLSYLNGLRFILKESNDWKLEVYILEPTATQPIVVNLNQEINEDKIITENISNIVSHTEFIQENYKYLEGKNVDSFTDVIEFESSRLCVAFMIKGELFEGDCKGIINQNNAGVCGITERNISDKKYVLEKLNENRFYVSKVKKNGINLEYQL